MPELYTPLPTASPLRAMNLNLRFQELENAILARGGSRVWFDVVVDFGADTEGIVDATTAFADALLAAGSVEYGAVFVPYGRYLITPGVLSFDYDDVVMEGMGTGSVLVPASYTGHLFTATNKVGITVKNLSTQGVPVEVDAVPDHWRAFRFTGCSYCHFDNVHSNLTPGGIGFIATNANPNCNYNHIVNCTMDDVGYCGIEMLSDNDQSTQGNRSVKGNVISNNICINNESLDGDTPLGRGYGIVCGYWAEQNVISNNVCNNNSHHGIYLRTHSRHNTVTGNIVCDNQGDGITAFYGPNGNTIDGNICRNNARTYGAGNITVMFGDSYPAVANVVTNNVCLESVFDDQETGDGGVGIYIRGAARTIVKGNICGRNGRAGIFVVPDTLGTMIGYNLIEGNFCYDNDFSNTGGSDAGGNVTNKYAAGITLFGASMVHTVVRGNYCYNTEAGKYQKYGIWIHSGATSGWVEGNYVANNRTGGVLKEGTAAEVRMGFNPGGGNYPVMAASNDATVAVPTVRIRDTTVYSGAVATPGTITGALEFYSEENSSGYPAVAGAVKSEIENTFGTQRGIGIYTNPAASAPVRKLYVSGAGNVVCNSAAIATNAVDGFFYIPTCAGTPTGVPTAYTGRVPMVFDTTTNKLYIYDLGWVSVTLT